MIDLHLHLLPGIDDGAVDLEVSRQMLETQKANGFKTLVATPHLSDVLTPDYSYRVERAFVRVRELAEPLEMVVRLGFEVFLWPDLPARLEQGERSTLAGSKTVLVEVPFDIWPAHADQTLFELQAAGFRPLLAHPERYRAVREDPERALRLAERGVVLQVSYSSLLGLIGNSAQRAAVILVQSADAVVVATDAHSVGKRMKAVPDALTRLRELVGEPAAALMIEDGPRALITDTSMPDLSVRTSARTNGKLGGRIRRMITTDR